MRCLGKGPKAMKGMHQCESGRNKHRKRERERDESGQSSVYGSAHLSDWASCLIFLLNPISHCREGVGSPRVWGGWSGSGSEEPSGLGASTWGETTARWEGQEGDTMSITTVSAVCVCVGAPLSASVELLATWCHREHALSLGTCWIWEYATAAACVETPHWIQLPLAAGRQIFERK